LSLPGRFGPAGPRTLSFSWGGGGVSSGGLKKRDCHEAGGNSPAENENTHELERKQEIPIGKGRAEGR